jgi:carbonic anhydrase
MASLLALVAPLAALLLVAPPPSAASCFHGTRLQARSVASPLEARAVAAPDYSYSGERGPFNWHGIKDAYKQCARGRNQSPVDIYPGTTGIKTVAASNRPMLNYPTQPNGQATNLGATIQTDASGTMTYEGVEYRLLQWHFHTPSEHRLRNLHHPFEVHFVHERVGEPKKEPRKNPP